MGNRAHNFADTHILVAECERIIALDLRGMLNRMGYATIEHAYSSEEALIKIRNQKPDVLIMDELIDGHSHGGELGKSIARNFKIPVMLLTASLDESRHHARMRNVRLVHKPFGEKEILASLKSILKNK
ncbi:MAG: response regulator [Spirochaetes bacterium]|nr:MAG: response regulator [Spirochaetota bacterium]